MNAANRPSRRSILQTGAALAAGWVLPGCTGPAATGHLTATTATTPSHISSTPVPVSADLHQPGVVTPPPAAAVPAAYDLVGAGRDAVVAVLGELGRRIAAHPELEVTVAVGASLFDTRFGLAGVAPRGLDVMASFPNDVLDPAQCHGDLLLQVGAASAPRPGLVGLVPDGLRPRWSLDGFRQDNTVTPAGRTVDRNLFGFRDGAGNPPLTDAAAVDAVVWVGPDQDEPAWTVGGTYQVVRTIRLATGLWDRETVERQEAVFGRRKSDGAALTGAPEDAAVSYDADPDGLTMPLDSHARRANPRTPGSERSTILRRGYSYRRGPDAVGTPDEGMVFVCFQRDLDAGFATVQRRLAGQALDRYILTFGAGYFVVLPGPGPGGPGLGAGLLTASQLSV